MGFHPNQAVSKRSESHPSLHVPSWMWPQKHHPFSTVSVSRTQVSENPPQLRSASYHSQGPKAPTLLPGVLLYQFSSTASNP